MSEPAVRSLETAISSHRAISPNSAADNQSRVPAVLVLSGSPWSWPCATACRPRPAATGAKWPEASILVVSIDTLRADHLPAYGYAAGRTPTIDRMARDGVVFENAYSTAPLTLPSHASILTGLLPSRHGVADNLGFVLDAATTRWRPDWPASAGALAPPCRPTSCDARPASAAASTSGTTGSNDPRRSMRSAVSSAMETPAWQRSRSGSRRRVSTASWRSSISTSRTRRTPHRRDFTTSRCRTTATSRTPTSCLVA